MLVKNKNLILKTLIVFICYLFYKNIIVYLCGIFNLGEIVSSFIADLIFFLGVVIAYKEDIKSDFIDYIKNYKLKDKIFSILKWVLIIFIANIIMGFISGLLFGDVEVDENTTTLNSLFDISFLYTAFLTLIFATVAEILVFQKSIRDVVDNKVAFVIVSSVIYTIMNFVYADLTNVHLGMYMFMYFLPALILSIAYVRNKDNVFILMFIKFVYNLIPFTILVLGG